MSLKPCLNLCWHSGVKTNWNLVNHNESPTAIACITKYVTWSRTANVKIQFIPFINDIRNERILEIFRSAINCTKRIKMSTRSLMDGSNLKIYGGWLVGKLCRKSTIFSHIFFEKDIPVLTNGTIFSHEEPLITPVVAIAALYWTNSFCFFGKQCIRRLVINHIQIIKERSYGRIMDSQ